MDRAPVRSTVIIIGQRCGCECVERQLDLLPARPVTLGWVLTAGEAPAKEPNAPILGDVSQLEAIVARRKPGAAIVTLPAAMSAQVAAIRTRLRRLGVPDRFFPTIEDQLAGIGPRTHVAIDLQDLLDRPGRKIDDAAVKSLVAGRRVLITGAGGSIGSELARKVAAFEPATLALIDRSENALFEIDRQVARFHPRLSRRALLHDVVLASETRAAFEQLKPQVILHAAAHKHVPMMEDHPASAIDNNLFGTKSVADAAVAVGAERMVLISTDKAVNPTSIMGATKRLAEMYVQHAHRRSVTAFSMVRFGNVLGSSGSVIDVWSRQIAEGGPLTVTDPRMTRYFMTIPEAAALVLQAAAMVDTASPDAQVFVLNMGEPVCILDMAARYVSAHGLVPVLDHGASEKARRALGSGAIRIIVTGARPGEKLHEELARDTESLQPTRHEDVDIWGLPQPEPQQIDQIIRTLSPEGRSRDAAMVAGSIRRLVPEMRSVEPNQAPRQQKPVEVPA